jgi:hypothetical protein
MNTYNIYKHPSGEVIAVKIGFSWPILFIGLFLPMIGICIWMLIKRLWLVSVAFLFGFIMINLLLSSIPVALLITLLVTFVVIAFNGNALVSKNLISKRGFVFLDKLEAIDVDSAKQFAIDKIEKNIAEEKTTK